jgi:hypothetical protein
MYILKQQTTTRVIANHRRHRCASTENHLLHLPLELLLRISGYLSFADLWYLATSSRYCKALAYQIIWHRYHIDLSKPQLHAHNHIVYGALAYISRHGYQQNKNIDHTVIQSVSNRLAVEIYDKSPLKNWEHCLDFFLDKTLGMIIDHIMLDPLLDIVPLHKKYRHDHHHLQLTEFYPTQMGQLMTSFLTTFYPTLLALFETEPTTEIHHRLLINHINRHIDIITHQYHNLHYQRCSSRPSLHKAVNQQINLLRLNFRILIRFIGTLVQTDLLSIKDINIITHQRILFFFVIDEPPKKKRKHSHKISMYESLKNHSTCGWLDELEFQMEVFVDLTRAALMLENTSEFVSVLDDTVNTLVNEII